MEIRLTLAPGWLFRLALAATSAAAALIAVSLALGAALPRGEQMLYSYAPAWRSGPWSIYILDVERRLAHAVANNWTRGNPALPVSWSPDGQRIAYMTYADYVRETFIYNLVTGRRYQINITNAADVQSAAWSPDSRALAFIGGEASDQIYVMDADGGEPRRLTPDGQGYMQLSWTADSRALVFHNRAPDYDIFVVQADGSGFRNLTQTPHWREINPAWSPDGQRIAFFSDREDGIYDLYVMNADGSGAVRYHAAPSSDSISAIVDVTWRALWSPDSRFVAFGSFSWRGGADLYVADLHTQRTLNLTDDLESDSSPGWSPDGRTLAYESRRDGMWNVYLLDISCVDHPQGCAGANRRLVSRSGNFRRPVWSLDGAQIALTASTGRGWSISTIPAGAQQADPALLTTIGGINFAPAWRP